MMQSMSEILSRSELSEIIGRSHRKAQIDWLNRKGWVFTINGAGEPIVGRMYARFKLAGLTPTVTGIGAEPAFDFDCLNG
jgi:hypothetical protein